MDKPTDIADNLVAYRLEQVEREVKSVNEKLDRHLLIEQTVQRNTYLIDSLVTTRNRVYAWLSGVSLTAVAALVGTLVR